MSAISPKGVEIGVADQLSAVGQRIQQGQDFIRTRMDKNLQYAARVLAAVATGSRTMRTWNSATGIQTQTPNELHLRLDTLEHSHAGVFERVDRMTLFAEQISQLITTLCTDIDDELAKSLNYKTHPDRIQRQILKSQEQTQTMQTAARKCEADLRQVYADVAALLEHAGVPDGPTYPQAASSQRTQPVSSPRDLVNAAVALISWTSQMIGRITMSAARITGLLSCSIRTKAGLQDLRERWAANDRDLKVFEEKLAVLIHKPTSQATREGTPNLLTSFYIVAFQPRRRIDKL
ncbi:hypothetical protein EXIGLDRAFT_702239 [Exidia glandulosa HHB12029]|uniref:Uncharacterized protein n=1 Tax=Exidia glandulosa HHB12029 TaxID=1314781 RepID=A0A165CN12_EXIGL|nr:hypothetical protein EXIGLDRAFT_702239 [Exidia glandulosa HHB12029]